MPIYEYQCKKCKNVFETLVLSADSSDKIVCRKCGSINVTKRMTPFSARSSDKGASVGMGSAGCSAKGGFS